MPGYGPASGLVKILRIPETVCAMILGAGSGTGSARKGATGSTFLSGRLAYIGNALNSWNVGADGSATGS